MNFTPRKINAFLLFKLPSAFFTGVRLKFISEEKAIVRVTYKWINQNPFKSMFWAVQGMASELSTGILVIQAIENSSEDVSMLVTNMKATFTKKVKGKIHFECDQGELVKEAIRKAIETNEGQTIILTSEGKNDEGVSFSKFEYEWSLKVKNKK